MTENTIELYTSSNGDIWYLHTADPRAPLVRHVPNPSSGGRTSELSVSQFLSSSARGPQHDALVHLIGDLAQNGTAEEVDRVDVSADNLCTIAEPLLLTTTNIRTFAGSQGLTNASGFFFERDDRLFLVTSRHVFIDALGEHFPDRVEFDIHTDHANLAAATSISVLLYEAGQSLWRQGRDDGGEVDIATIEIEKSVLPAGAIFRTFSPAHLPSSRRPVAIGDPLLIVGYPLSFHDSLHHLPVARQGIVASSYGLRFQGKGCFITDARTHAGTSGAPVVTRTLPRETPASESDELPWTLLGVHSSTISVSGRNAGPDESLGLNSVWYSDILLVLTSN